MSCDTVFNTLSAAYAHLLWQVYHRADYHLKTVTPEDTKGSDEPITKDPAWYRNRRATRECVHVAFTVTEPAEDEAIVTRSEARNRTIRDYAAAETVAFDTNDDEALKALSAVWRDIQNPDGSVNANYGRMVYHLRDAGGSFDTAPCSQWEWAIRMLRLSRDTNQAYLHFNRPKDQWPGNKDQPCCMYIQFMIRQNRLCLFVNYRSNDLVFGFPYNMLYFVKLLHRMLRELREVYPTLQLGDLHYYAASLHFYEHQREMVQDMLGE